MTLPLHPKYYSQQYPITLKQQVKKIEKALRSLGSEVISIALERIKKGAPLAGNSFSVIPAKTASASRSNYFLV
jgi:hypothetical protein